MTRPEEQFNDDFLRELLQATPLESPGDDFVEKVMAGIHTSPALLPEKKPFSLDILAWWPYVLAGSLLLLFMLTSDLPYSHFIPGKDYFSHTIIPAFLASLSGLKTLFAGPKGFSIPLAVLFSGIFLFLVDRFLFRRFTTTHIFFF
jgi:hypothetical protein